MLKGEWEIVVCLFCFIGHDHDIMIDYPLMDPVYRL